jgi:hypothetical protein
LSVSAGYRRASQRTYLSGTVGRFTALDAKLENTLLEALYPGIKIAVVQVPTEPLDAFEESVVANRMASIVHNNIHYKLVGASGSSKDGKFYFADQEHAPALAERFHSWPQAAIVYFGILVSPCQVVTHSATGEEWSDDANAATSAEAQSFKRAAACFGLGRYLYHFTGQWVDLDGRKRPKKTPILFGWATPEGWQNGLRPGNTSGGTRAGIPPAGNNNSCSSTSVSSPCGQLVQEIECMQSRLGIHMYRGLLRSAQAWKPSQIRNVTQQRQTLERMQAAERGLQRLRQAMENLSQARVAAILNSLKIRSIDRISDLQTLHALVVKLEEAN